MTNNFRMFFGDAEHAFALDLDLIVELERVTDCGIGRLAARIFGDSYSVADLRQTIRLGLIGGGMEPEDADRLVKVYALRTGIVRLRLIAMTVLETVFAGDEVAA